MFRDQYQEGKYFPLLSIQEKDSLQRWLSSGGSLKKAFDKSVKGYVYITDVNTKLSLPKARQDLHLIQSMLLLQIKILDKKSFSLEIVFTDHERVKRRLLFSGATHFNYSKHNIAKAPLNARVPTNMLLEGVWLNLQFDIGTFIQNCFDTTQFQFRSIDGITLSGACLIRRISTCRAQIPDSFQYVIEKEFGEAHAHGYEDYVQKASQQRGQHVEPLEAKLDFGQTIDHMNQIISFDRLVYFGYIFEQSGMLQ